MKVLTAADILAVEDAAVERVSVPEWGGEVYLKELEASEVHRQSRAKDDVPFVVRLVWASLVDEHGVRLFPSPTALQQLGKKSIKVMARLQNKVLRLNGMRRDAAESTPELIDQACDALDQLIERGAPASLEDIKAIRELISGPSEVEKAKNA